MPLKRQDFCTRSCSASLTPSRTFYPIMDLTLVIPYLTPSSSWSIPDTSSRLGIIHKRMARSRRWMAPSCKDWRSWLTTTRNIGMTIWALETVLYAYRTKAYSTLRISPYELLYGIQPPAHHSNNLHTTNRKKIGHETCVLFARSKYGWWRLSTKGSCSSCRCSLL